MPKFDAYRSINNMVHNRVPSNLLAWSPHYISLLCFVQDTPPHPAITVTIMFVARSDICERVRHVFLIVGIGSHHSIDVHRYALMPCDAKKVRDFLVISWNQVLVVLASILNWQSA